MAAMTAQCDQCAKRMLRCLGKVLTRWTITSKPLSRACLPDDLTALTAPQASFSLQGQLFTLHHRTLQMVLGYTTANSLLASASARASTRS